MYRCGYVGVFGRPNAGKSTLVNALVGQQVAIVSSKPQTTRDNILGIVNESNTQIILVDTPGIHHSKNQLDKTMMKNVRSAMAGVDVILYLVDGTFMPDEEELENIQHIKEKAKEEDISFLLVMTKKDKPNKNTLACDYYISSFTGESLQELKQKLISLLPQSDIKNFVYEEDYFTDKSIRFLVAEKVRETALNLLKKEVPHGICVQIERFEEKENITIIEANLICEQERHKAIILGKGGEKIKQIGQVAREYAEELLETKVLLKLFVKVDKNWRDRQDKVASYKVD